MDDDRWGIIGHEWAIDMVRHALRTERAGHAYLLCGPPAIGKATIALRLAQALLCGAAAAPCGRCRDCTRIAHGNHPDVRSTGLAEQGQGLKAEEAARQRDLKIDSVRGWIADLALQPYEGRRRVFIMHDAERLNDSGANALLKTLEEPPPYAMIILVANTTGDLMPTIVSRCRMLRLRPVPRATIDAALQSTGVAPAEARLLAAWSGGRVGWALQMRDDPAAWQALREQLDELIALGTLPRHAGLEWAEARAQAWRRGEHAAVTDELLRWQLWWRDVLLAQAGQGRHMTHLDRAAEAARAATQFHIGAVHAFLVRLTQAHGQLRENVNPQLVFEGLVLHRPRPH
ncbi:MAG: DNA polymerase III subunit delta' [Chloroflexi bacterium]|nr:DNA polymerase III subunit delta' [Chloroflexota bacterium]